MSKHKPATIQEYALELAAENFYSAAHQNLSSITLLHPAAANTLGPNVTARLALALAGVQLFASLEQDPATAELIKTMTTKQAG